MKTNILKLSMELKSLEKRCREFVCGRKKQDEANEIGVNKGLGTIELVLIIFVLVTLVIMFKDKAIEVVGKYLQQVDPKFTR